MTDRMEPACAVLDGAIWVARDNLEDGSPREVDLLEHIRQHVKVDTSQSDRRVPMGVLSCVRQVDRAKPWRACAQRIGYVFLDEVSVGDVVYDADAGIAVGIKCIH